MWERYVPSASSRLSLTLSVLQKRDQKNSSWEGEGINALCQLIGQWVTDSLKRGIDSRKEIDLWLLHSLTLIVQFNSNHLMKPKQALVHRVRLDLGVMATKTYWSLNIRWFSVISRTFVGGGVIPLNRNAVGVFYNPSWLGCPYIYIYTYIYMCVCVCVYILYIYIYIYILSSDEHFQYLDECQFKQQQL